MQQQKRVRVIYVPAIPIEESGIGEAIPAHIKLQWRDVENRRLTLLLDLSESQVKEISNLPTIDYMENF